MTQFATVRVHVQVAKLENFDALGWHWRPQHHRLTGKIKPLEDRQPQAVSALSRGMRQRASLARTLIQTPEVLLLDEPFTGLDEASSRILVREMEAHKARGGLCILATHDLERVLPMADRVLWISRGRVVRCGTRPDGGWSGLLREYSDASGGRG